MGFNLKRSLRKAGLTKKRFKRWQDFNTPFGEGSISRKIWENPIGRQATQLVAGAVGGYFAGPWGAAAAGGAVSAAADAQTGQKVTAHTVGQGALTGYAGGQLGASRGFTRTAATPPTSGGLQAPAMEGGMGDSTRLMIDSGVDTTFAPKSESSFGLKGMDLGSSVSGSPAPAPTGGLQLPASTGLAGVADPTPKAPGGGLLKSASNFAAENPGTIATVAGAGISGVAGSMQQRAADEEAAKRQKAADMQAMIREYLANASRSGDLNKLLSQILLQQNIQQPGGISGLSFRG